MAFYLALPDFSLSGRGLRDVGHVCSVGPLFLAVEGTEQTLFANNCDVCSNVSGGYLKNRHRRNNLFHLNQNSEKQQALLENIER